jgi:putative chitinase
MVTVEELRAIMPAASHSKLLTFVTPLNATMKEFGISDTPEREAAFIAQLAHESGGFHYVRELASGEAYEGRADLGNTEPGDGIRYRGRGLIQITGRANYRACGEALDLPLEDHPTLLELPVNACRSAGWYWASRKLNDLADKGDFLLITKRINGGFRGIKERTAYYERAKDVLSS